MDEEKLSERSGAFYNGKNREADMIPGSAFQNVIGYE